ncbi:MAG: MFS transporter, partial [Anaerolineaceae bacterium]|nr:MFS transporter [Anaerolineaceae bacterium]
MASLATERPPAPLALQVAHFVFTRWSMNIGVRMVYPFLGLFAAGMGVDLAVISLALSLRAFTGILSPLVTQVADRRSRRSGILIGLGLYTAGVIVMALWPLFPVFVVTQCVASLGNFILVSSIQASIGDQVVYSRRGRVIAIIELGWSLSFILGMPLVASLMDNYGWTAGFALLGVLGTLVICGTWLIVPGRQHEAPRARSAYSFRQVLSFPVVRAGLIMTFSIVAANEVVNLVFGVWMQESYGLALGALGLASGIIGLSELSGESITAWVVDRVGKQKTIRAGILLNAVIALALPWLGRLGLAGALVGLFLFYFSFELTIVSSLPLMTELL